MSGVRVKIDRKTLNFNGAMVDALKNAMKLSMTHLEGQVKKKTPVNFGHLQSGIVGHTRSPFHGEIAATMPGKVYIEYVEEGRKPGKMPPYKDGSALFLWVKRKLKLSGSELINASFLIARAIGKPGTKAVHMFKLTEQQEENKVQRIFRQAIKKAERKTSDG